MHLTQPLASMKIKFVAHANSKSVKESQALREASGCN